jgi:hypothetical protein
MDDDAKHCQRMPSKDIAVSNRDEVGELKF